MTSNPGNSKVPSRQTDRTLRYERRTPRIQTIPNQEAPLTQQTRGYTQTEAHQNSLPKQSWDEQIANEQDGQKNLETNKGHTNPQEQGKTLKTKNRAIRIDDTDIEMNNESETEQDQP
ncbi:2362_t:CDS:2, partial [Acaulospora morrowiae]